MSEHCPKCGAGFRLQMVGLIEYHCESRHERGEWMQSSRCRVTELEQQLSALRTDYARLRDTTNALLKQADETREKLRDHIATITADKESFGVKVHEAAVREGQWLALLGLKPGDDLAAGIQSLVARATEAEQDLRVHKEFAQHGEQMNGKFLYAIDQIREHYDDEWKLKGDGKWRIDEMTKWHRHMWNAYREALQADNETIEQAADDRPRAQGGDGQ